MELEPTVQLPPYRFASAVPDVVFCTARHYVVQIGQATMIGDYDFIVLICRNGQDLAWAQKVTKFTD